MVAAIKTRSVTAMGWEAKRWPSGEGRQREEEDRSGKGSTIFFLVLFMDICERGCYLKNKLI